MLSVTTGYSFYMFIYLFFCHAKLSPSENRGLAILTNAFCHLPDFYLATQHFIIKIRQNYQCAHITINFRGIYYTIQSQTWR